MNDFYVKKRNSCISLKTDGNVFCAQIAPVSTREELFQELNCKLSFPYFGYNWDALYDLYTDFHWIEQKKIQIVHEELSSLPKNVLQIYMKIVLDTYKWWERYPEHDVDFFWIGGDGTK